MIYNLATIVLIAFLLQGCANSNRTSATSVKHEEHEGMRYANDGWEVR